MERDWSLDEVIPLEGFDEESDFAGILDDEVGRILEEKENI